MVKPKNEVGNVYGRLTVIKEIGRRRGAVLFICHCECGNDCEVTGCDLRSGRVHSCGCYKSEFVTEGNITHGLRDHRLYSIYHNMITRCYNPNATHYKDYGGRGIKICNEWLNDFMKFYNWSINNGYSDELTIDRINVNGDYYPNNCRWATVKEQNVNKRNNKYININGEIKLIKDWCDIFYINIETVRNRVKRGWDVINAITTPPYTKYIGKKRDN
jgi:hypothetical protein